MDLCLSLLTSLLFLLMVILHPQFCSALSHSCKTTKMLVISTTLGKKAELPCYFPFPHEEARQFRMKWVKYTAESSQPDVILEWPKSSQAPVKDTKALFSWNDEEMVVGNFSLSLQKVKENDSGLYSCVVWQGWDCEMVTNITVKITECQVLSPVMAPPSADVVLPCSSAPTAEEVKNVTVSWQLVTGKQKIVILRYPPSAPMGPTAQVLQGRVRFSGNPQEGRVALNVSNVKDTDTNWYRCDLHMQETQSCYEVRLEVRESQSAAIMTAGPVTFIKDLTNITPITSNEEDSGSPGSGAVVVTLVFLVSTCVIAVAAGLIIYILRYKGARGSRNLDIINLQESPYSNIDIRDSVPNTFYTLAYSEDTCCEQRT